QHYNPRCQPPWPETDLRHKAEEADKDNFDKPRGWLLADDFHLTDWGNARRVVKKFGTDLRYSDPLKSFFPWDGTRWQEDQTRAAVRMIEQTQAEFCKTVEAEKKRAGEDEARLGVLKKMLAHAHKWESARGISDCRELLKAEKQLVILPKQFNRDVMLLN